MNIYIFNETRRGAVFGVGTYIRELITALKNTNIHICVVNLLSDKPQIVMECSDGIDYWYFPEPIQEIRTLSPYEQRNLYFHNVVYLLQLYIRDKTNLVFHLNFPQCEQFIDELRNVFNCKIIAVVHFLYWGLTIFDNLSRLHNILENEFVEEPDKEIKRIFEEEKAYYLKADCCICLSQYMYKVMCQEYKLDAKKISVVGNGLGDGFCNLSDSKQIRKKWNIQENEKIILFVGRLDEVKGVRYLIKAFREVVKDYSNVRLIIAGSGEYDDCFLEAREACTKITFTGLLEKESLYEMYQIADIGVIPSLFEPFGYVAVEMMMYALPLITTATSGVDEVVDDTCGFKVPLIKTNKKVEIDPLLLAEKIMYLLQHSDVAHEMGQNGRKRYLAKYSSETFCQNMVQLYSSL